MSDNDNRFAGIEFSDDINVVPVVVAPEDPVRQIEIEDPTPVQAEPIRNFVIPRIPDAVTLAPVAPVTAPATAALHAEKINLNPAPKPGIATASSPGSSSGPFNPSGTMPRTGTGTSLTPLAVPANAQKSPLPLPNLGIPPVSTSTAAAGKGNIFSKFLKK